MKPKKSIRSSPSTGKSGPLQARGGGFDGLDPSKMGFAMPEWLETPGEGRHVVPDGVSPESATPAASGTGGGSPARSEPETRSVVEGMKVVCICKGIKKRVFWKALDAGVCTHEDINRHTGSGSGSCQGRRCGPRILDMLKHLRR
jgi:bacterioferritin-associated ferredoxin